MSFFKVFLVINIISLQIFLTKSYCTKSLVPALYVFGDSTVDSGNNNNLNTAAKANIFPYGIDFNNCSTGRFSNGKTIADIIAIKLGLPMPPPYLGVSTIERYQIASGINYASGSCGILNSTRSGECLSLDKQIEYFTSTVVNDLPRNFQSKAKLRHYLSKSIFLVSIGSNDYTLNYFKQEMELKQQGNPEVFADYLLEQLSSRIKKIYELGGRKFVIVSVGAIGCGPGSKDCNEIVLQKVMHYSQKLPMKLKELEAQLSSSLFTIMDTFKLFMNIRNFPEKFGLTNTRDSCIMQGGKPCENRKQYHFYDTFGHTTEAANEIYANKCFSEKNVCSPLNIERLAHTQ